MREGLIESKSAREGGFIITPQHGRTRYHIFKQPQNKRCRKLHVERRANLQRGDFSKVSAMWLVYKSHLWYLVVIHFWGLFLKKTNKKQPEGLLSVYLRARLRRGDAELRRGTPLKVAMMAQKSVLGRVLYLNLHPA